MTARINTSYRRHVLTALVFIVSFLSLSNFIFLYHVNEGHLPSSLPLNDHTPWSFIQFTTIKKKTDTKADTSYELPHPLDQIQQMIPSS
jgi:hypothetical protein